MKDRLSSYPGRVVLTPVAGVANTFDMVRADAPTEEGTALNKANLLKDTTASLFGLGADAVPDEVLAFLGKYNQHWWRRRAEEQVLAESYKNTRYRSTDSWSVTITYSSNIVVNWDTKTVTLASPTSTVTFKNSNFNNYETLLAPLSGKYVQIDNVVCRFGGYEYDDYEASSGSDYVDVWMYVLTPTSVVSEWDYYHASDRSAYPDNGEVDGYVYEYLGIFL